ncbi:hypothetical protein CHLNCDRAFT_50475 [Chlorella variabilis]|uniref:Apple domain-containing protein n=1 Tax=Chlorella variabilis TaxID=554065 RepID=E1Z6H5_CHLVA|nr:hypothetical protein CHLNCDRAFT_50475 [Chlorella variabilis]EFN58932.1 hypothetical protein CHLNCDRAFT_50475 [Chlorella variabilis]|eukprot:XP_005851034.1 hypothetical protein CHLNCDRAFT_50475 [Chlorella variabilis]
MGRSPVELRMGSTGAGLFVGCGVGVGIVTPVALHSIPVLGQLSASLSASLGSLNAATGGFAGAARGRLRGLGVRHLDAGFGCGMMLGYGWGAGIMLSPTAQQSIGQGLQAAGRALLAKLPQPLQAALQQRQHGLAAPAVAGLGAAGGLGSGSCSGDGGGGSSALGSPAAEQGPGARARQEDERPAAYAEQLAELTKLVLRQQNQLGDLGLQDLSMALLSSRSAGRMPLPLAALVLAALFPRAQAITAADVLAFRATDGCISVEHTISFKVPDFVFPNIPEIVRMADVHLPAVVASAGAPAPGAGTCPMRSALPLPPANLLGSAVCAPIPSLQKDAAVAACRSYGEFWQLAGFNNKPYNLDVRNTRVDYQVTCYRCGLEDCAMLWFDNEAQCAGTCPSGWTPVTVPMRSGPMIPQGQGNPVLNDPHFGSPCSGGPGKVLCSLCGRIECADCRYAWRGAPGPSGVCADSECRPEERLVGTDLYAGGEPCLTGKKSLCEKCALPIASSQGASATAARRPTCFKRKCTKPKRKARFTDRPAYRVAGVTTYAGCCKRCRIATGCVRFQISAKGCAIYRTEPRRKAVRAAGYVVGYNRKA